MFTHLPLAFFLLAYGFVGIVLPYIRTFVVAAQKQWGPAGPSSGIVPYIRASGLIALIISPIVAVL